MKKLISLGFLSGLICIFAGLCMYFKSTIVEFYTIFISPKKEIKLESKNNYYRNYDFLYVQQIDNLIPHNYNELINIYYTVLNAGEENFSFYCPKDYEQCLDDVKNLANDQNTLSDINNYVHPFNGFSHIETEYDSVGRVTIKAKHTYSQEQIAQIEQEVNRIYNEQYNSQLTPTENIRKFHDYIINNSKYDMERTTNNNETYHSDTAYGPLFEGYAVCGGYTDLMELFLEKMGIKSYRISSEKHIWNAVEINGNWRHLDLTWDDPVASDGNNYLEHSYFLIDTQTLQNMEKTEHYFNLEHYQEFA